MRLFSRAFVYSSVLGLAGLLGAGSTPAKAQGYGYAPIFPAGGINVQVGGPQFAVGFQSGYVAPVPVYGPAVGIGYGYGYGPRPSYGIGFAPAAPVFYRGGYGYGGVPYHHGGHHGGGYRHW